MIWSKRAGRGAGVGRGGGGGASGWWSVRASSPACLGPVLSCCRQKVFQNSFRTGWSVTRKFQAYSLSCIHSGESSNRWGPLTTLLARIEEKRERAPCGPWSGDISIIRMEAFFPPFNGQHGVNRPTFSAANTVPSLLAAWKTSSAFKFQQRYAASTSFYGHITFSYQLQAPLGPQHFRY